MRPIIFKNEFYIHIYDECSIRPFFSNNFKKLTEKVLKSIFKSGSHTRGQEEDRMSHETWMDATQVVARKKAEEERRLRRRSPIKQLLWPMIIAIGAILGVALSNGGLPV